jgi:hypothetical protein
VRTAILELAMTSIFLSAMLLAAMPSHRPTAELVTGVQEPLDKQALLPDAQVFFLPGSSALSPVAQDVVAQAAHHVGSGTIVVIRAFYDHEAGETAETAYFRCDVVRDELVREGVSNSAIRALISDSTRTGIEARRVAVSAIPEALDQNARGRRPVS